MATLSRDTTAEIEQWQVERLREMPAWRKLALVDEMSRTVRSLALAGLRQRHPNDSPARLRRRLADLLLGSELAERAYGPLAEEQVGTRHPSAGLVRSEAPQGRRGS